MKGSALITDNPDSMLHDTKRTHLREHASWIVYLSDSNIWRPTPIHPIILTTFVVRKWNQSNICRPFAGSCTWLYKSILTINLTFSVFVRVKNRLDLTGSIRRCYLTIHFVVIPAYIAQWCEDYQFLDKYIFINTYSCISPSAQDCPIVGLRKFFDIYFLMCA